MKFFYFFLCFLIFSSGVYAASSMGVTPPDNTYIYTGQDTLTGSFTVHPKDDKNVKVYAYGDLKDYLFFEGNKSELRLHLTESQVISFTIRIPDNFKPGDHIGTIIVEQYLSPEEILKYGASAIAFAAIGHVVKVRVPSEGKFLEPTFSISPNPSAVGDVVYFTIDLLNLGTDDIIDIGTVLIIKDAAGTPVSERETTKIGILHSAESGALKAFLETEGMSAGRYPVNAEILYGGYSPVILGDELRIGGILIIITNIETSLDSGLVKFFIDVESNWNDQIENVYAELIVSNSSQEVIRTKTSAIDLGPWGKGRLEAYLEREKLHQGTYSVDTLVYYYDKQAQKQIRVEIPRIEKPSPFSPLLVIGLTVLAVLLILN